MSIDPQRLVECYRQMLRIRLVEEAIAEVYPEQEIRCPVHLCVGQEAVSVGVCAALERSDYALSAHRSHGHYLAKGGDLEAMLAELYGKVTGCCKGRGGSMHLVDVKAGFLGAVPIVGSTIPIAVGAALGTTMRNEARVVISFFGDAAIEEGVFHESLNFAVLQQLPVVFVCENNAYSTYSHLSVRQPANREIYGLARGHGIESLQGDGNNVIEVYEMTRAAVQKAHAGGGPTFLEFKTYRWREHCGPAYDDHLGYRAAGELALWQERCPIKRLESALTLAPEDITRMTMDIQTEIKAAFEFARRSPFPQEGKAIEDVYAQ